MKLHMNLFDAARLDIEPTGAFFRSFLHERRRDPHISMHWLPKPGATRNSPHGTRRGEPRVWLPEFEHDQFLGFIGRFKAQIVMSFIDGARWIDLVRAEVRGWRFCATVPPNFFASTITEKRPDEIEWRMNADSIIGIAEHALAAAAPPTNFEGRGPGGPSPIVQAIRFRNGRVIDCANVMWLERGLWDPFVEGDPVQIGAPGYYVMPRRLITREMFGALLGPMGETGMKNAMEMIANFFGPAVRNVEAEVEDLEQRMARVFGFQR